ncbi:Carbamoyl-phosphate synthase large chain, chloroplastic, partial [Mucuna pruriens]
MRTVPSSCLEIISEVFLLEANPQASCTVPLKRLFQNLSAKEAVFPSVKFHPKFIAFTKAQVAAGHKLPLSGIVFLSLNDLIKPYLKKIANAFVEIGFQIVSTSGT